MPVYLTRTMQFRSKVEAFERRGLDNQASAKVSELAIVTVSPRPLENTIRFANLSSELSGRLDGAPQKYNEIPRAVLRRFSGEAPFEAPTLIVEMKTGGEVLNGLGLFEVATSKQGIYGGQPTMANFVSVCNLGIDFYQNVPAGNVNIAGYIAFLQAWRGVRAFFAMGGGDIGEGGVLKAFISPQGARGLAPQGAVEPVVTESGELVKEGRPGKQGGGTITVAEPFIFMITGSRVALDGIPTVSTSQELDFKGLLFPYFREMLEPDVDFAYTVFISLFSLCLENGEDQTTDAIAVHRRGFRYLANSHSGRIIQHVYLGIKLAIESGSQLVLVKDGSDYAGFVLKGENFRVAVQNRVYVPIKEEDLSIELATLDVSNRAVKNLFDLLVAVSREDGMEEQRTVQEMKRNPRVIREMVQSRSPEDIDAIRSTINELISDIKYHQTFWEITAENIRRFMEAMKFKHPMHDEPMYLHIDVVCSRSSDILQYLSVFGPQAPSIYHGTKTLTIRRPGEDDPNLEVVDERRKVPHIPFVKKGLAAAGLDWASVYRQKAFRYTPSDPRFGGRGFSMAKKRDGVIDNPSFDLFYMYLREWVFTGVEPARRIKRKSDGGEDQGEDDEEMSAAPRKKTKFSFL